MKKYKLILSLTTVTGVITPVMALSSCGNQTTTYKAIPESMLNFEGNVLLGLKEGASIDSYDTLVVPQDTVYIADEAFKDIFNEEANSSIKTIIFNKNLKSIGSSAFENCTSLTCLDLTAMKDINVMSLRLGSATTFASCSNKSGRVKLPEGITDMQLEWIKSLFENAGLPGSWFGDIEAPDQETVDAINAILEQQTTACSTMSDLIDYVYVQSGYDLEALVPSNANEQYVWDAEKNKVIEIDQSGNLTCGPKDYKLEAKPINIWKMVKPVGATKALKASSSNDAIYADEFSETTTYSQYLRTEYKQTWEATKSFSFQSGFDTGNVEKLELTYTKPEVEAGDTPVINTMKSSLTIEGSLDSIDHYGNLTELTVESLGTAETYSEYGSVDAAIVIKSGIIDAKEGSDINSVVVTSTTGSDVHVNVDAGGYVGSVGATEPAAVAQIQTIVTVDPEAEVEKDKIVETQAVEKPSEEGDFYSGKGTKLSPWCIKNKKQLLKFAEKVRKQEYPSAEDQNFYFNIVGDIDMSGTFWVPVGTSSAPFKGIFNGCGFTIKGLTIISNTRAETVGYGLFAYTDGTVNSSFTSRDSIWSSSNELIEENISEDKYSTVIKNVSLDSIDYRLLGNERCIGGIVGVAQNTYMYNCQVKTGSISGLKTVGGICGSVAGCVLKLCEAGDEEGTLTIHARSYNVAGMFGRTEDKASYSGTNIAMIKCATGSNCTISMDTCSGGGYASGFTAYSPSHNTIAVEGSVNAATVEYNGTYDDTEICGFIAFVSDGNKCLIANSINKGYIKATGNARVKNAAGFVVSHGSKTKLYNCVNSGKIVANAINSVAGVAAGCEVSGLPTLVQDQMLEISLCSNTSTTISNPLDETKKSEVCDNIVGLMISDTTFANVQEVNDLINHAGATTTQITFKNCTLTDPSGSLTLPSNISTVYADKSICENITVNSNFSKINVYVPNQNITVTENSDCVLYAYGANNKITIEEGASVKSVYALGEGSEIVNNGTVKRTIGLDNTAKKATNNGTCANIRFGRCENYYQYVASTEMTFINNGTITGLADPSESVNDVITVYAGSLTSPLITIKNYGTIKYQNNGLSTPAKLISFTRHTHGYTLGGNLQLECYENSKIISDCQNFFQTTGGDDSRTKALLKWKEGYKVYEDGGINPTTFADIKTYYENAGTTLKISVEQMQ